MSRAESIAAAKKWLNENRAIVAFMQELASLPDLEQEISSIEVRKNAANAELTEVLEGVAEARSQLAATKAAITTARTDAKAIIDSANLSAKTAAERAAKKAEAEVAEAEEEVAEAKKELAELKAQQAGLTGQIKALKREADELEDRVEKARTYLKKLAGE